MSNLKDIEERNKRVEADKAWETSITRRLLIALGTYIIVSSYLHFLGVEDFLWHGLVPACAYLISTLTLPLFKTFWIENIYKRKDLS